MLARDIEMFIEHCGLKGLSTKTINSYEQTLRLFMQYMDEQGILQTEKITHLAIQCYIKNIKERGKYTVTTNPNSGNYQDHRVDFGKRVSDVTINNYLRNTMKEKVQDCWKFYLPAAALGAGTIACILGSNALNKKQIASLTAGYMALGKAYQEYRREVAEHVGAEHEKEIYKDARSVLKEPTSDMVEDKLLCYEPISKRYFHATEAALLEAFYSLNRDFALNGYASMNDLYNYLGLDYIPEGDLKGWCADYLAADWEYFWIDFSYLKQKTDDGLEVYYVEAYQEPIDDYLNYDPSKDTPF